MVDNTGVESEQDFDFGADGNIPPGTYNSPITLLQENTLVPDEGTFCLPVITTQARLLEMLSMIRAAAIALELPETGDYNIDLYKAIEVLNECGVMQMSCEDVADCVDEMPVVEAINNLITNNTTTINSIYQTVNNSGFGNPNSVNTALTTIPDRMAIGKYEEPIKVLVECHLDALWAALREGVVKILDDTARTLLENAVTVADVAERAIVFVDAVPVLGDLAEGVMMNFSQVAPDILNLYEAYSSEAHLDEIACDLFAIVCSECRYPTFKELLDYYFSLGIISANDPTSVTLDVIMQALIDSEQSVAKVCYFTIMAWQLLILAIEAGFADNKGSDSITRMATLGEDNANNNWIQLCQTCNEPYQLVEYDFTTGTHGWKLLPQIGSGGFGGQFVAGQGWKWTNNASGNWAVIGLDIQPQWRIRAIGYNFTGVINLAQSAISLRPTPGSNTGVFNLSSLGQGITYNRSNCALVAQQGFSQIQMGINAGDANPAYIQKAFVVYDRDFGTGMLSSTRNIC